MIRIYVFPVKNIDTHFASINIEVDNVTMWFKSNKLFLNVNKTKWSLFHPLSKLKFIFSLSNLFTDSMHIKREHVTDF